MLTGRKLLEEQNLLSLQQTNIYHNRRQRNGFELSWAELSWLSLLGTGLRVGLPAPVPKRKPKTRKQQQERWQKVFRPLSRCSWALMYTNVCVWNRNISPHWNYNSTFLIPLLSTTVTTFWSVKWQTQLNRGNLNFKVAGLCPSSDSTRLSLKYVSARLTAALVGPEGQRCWGGGGGDGVLPDLPSLSSPPLHPSPHLTSPMRRGQPTPTHDQLWLLGGENATSIFQPNSALYLFILFFVGLLKLRMTIMQPRCHDDVISPAKNTGCILKCNFVRGADAGLEVCLCEFFFLLFFVGFTCFHPTYEHFYCVFGNAHSNANVFKIQQHSSRLIYS